MPNHVFDGTTPYAASLALVVGCAHPSAHRDSPQAEPPNGSRHGHADHAHGHADHAHGHADHTRGMPGRFDDATAWSRRFDAPERDAWQKPDAVLAALELPGNARVAEIGAGTGYFAARLAHARPNGRILGLDVEPDMVRFMTERAAKEALKNLEARLTLVDRAALDVDTDLVLVVDTYHHLRGRVAYFRALIPYLAPGGRVAIVDYRSNSPKGPPSEHKVAPDVVEQELGEAGFQVTGRFEFLPEQFFLVFSPRL